MFVSSRGSADRARRSREKAREEAAMERESRVLQVEQERDQRLDQLPAWEETEMTAARPRSVTPDRARGSINSVSNLELPAPTLPEPRLSDVPLPDPTLPQDVNGVPSVPEIVVDQQPLEVRSVTRNNTQSGRAAAHARPQSATVSKRASADVEAALAKEHEEEMEKRKLFCMCVPTSRNSAVREMLLYMCFLTIFTVILLGRNDDWGYAPRFGMAFAAQDKFTNTDGFWYDDNWYKYDTLSSAEDMWDYLTGPFVAVLSTYVAPTESGTDDNATLYGNADTSSVVPNFYLHSNIIGDVHIVQKRVERGDCDVLLDLGTEFKAWAATEPHGGGPVGSRRCFPKYKNTRQSYAAYGPSGRFTFSEDPQGWINAPLMGPDMRYDSGGFTEVIQMPPRGGNTSTFIERTREQLASLYNDSFVDEATSALMVDFTLFNPAMGYFCTVRIFFEFMVAGGLNPKAFFRVHRFFNYENAIDAIFVTMEVILYVTVFLAIKEQIRLMLEQKCKYFQVKWNYLEMINLTLFVTQLILRIITDISAYRLRREAENGVPYVNWHPLAYTMNQTFNIAAFNAVLCWVKVLKYLGVSPNMSQLERVLSRASRHILIFAVMFFIVYFGFAFGFHLAFRTNVEGFRSMGDSMFSLFRALLGDFDFVALQTENFFLGPLLFVLFVFLVVMVLLNMFLAIINDSYAKTQEEMVEVEDLFARELKQYLLDVRHNYATLFKMKGRNDVTKVDGTLQQRASLIAKDLEAADANQDNHIDALELHRVLKSNDAAPLLGSIKGPDGTYVAPTQLTKHVMAKYDTDQDGVLNKHEVGKLKEDMADRAVKIDQLDRGGMNHATAAKVKILEKKLDRTLQLLEALCLRNDTFVSPDPNIPSTDEETSNSIGMQ